MQKNKTSLRDTFVEAVRNYKKKNYKLAESICYKILSINPNDFEAKSLLGNIFAKNLNYKQAKVFLSEAIKLKPNNINTLNNLGTICKQLGELKNAVSYYKKVIQIDPNNINAHYNLGATCYDLKKLQEAKNYLQKAIELQPNFALPFLVLGNVHTDLKEYENAISSYKKAIELNDSLASAHNNLGLIFRTLNDFQNAISCYKKAIKIKTDHVGAHHNLALALKESGNFNEAIKSHEIAIKYEPENLAHYFYLSKLKRNILDDNLKNKIEKIINKDDSTKNNAAYGNFLLSEYEKKKQDYEKELNYLIKGHKNFFELKKSKFDLLVKYTFDNMPQIAEETVVEKLSKKNSSEVKPIFIIGVPRCGSTLVEKIIGSCEKLIPMGEETSVLEEYVTSNIIKKNSLNLGDVGNVRKEISDIYRKKGLILEKYDYTFTDKSLNNFFFLKLIKDIYPNAKIINCKRDELSSIMSIFQNNLTELAWAHDLDNIFKYFDNYFKITEGYKKINSNFIYELKFEELVNNPEEESKKLMKFCELPWDKKCLEFYKRKDLFSKTASNVQIRQAVYKHSLDKYLPYKKILDKYGKKYSWFN